ncbi:MAG: hypothetical protein RSD17_02735 [Oscillospiraceae bacterium]
MANKPYNNFVLESMFEDQYKSKLDLMQFCEVDNSLVGTAGDKVIVNTYTATDGTEVLTMGNGNTKDIEVSFEDAEYVIELLQNRHIYFDEQEMKDPKIVEKGLIHMVEDMFNTANGKAMAEFQKAKIEVICSDYNFDAFVDGVSLFPNIENEDTNIFAFISKKDVAELRKKLKDDLKFVEAYSRTGYIGTVAGVNIFVSKIATQGEIVLAIQGAVRYINKTGTEVEQDRDINLRKNTIVSRKYGIFAFADATKAVKLVKYPTVLGTLLATSKAGATGKTVVTVNSNIPDGYAVYYKAGTTAGAVTLGTALSGYTAVTADGIITMSTNTHLTLALANATDSKPIKSVDLTGGTLVIGA